MITTGFTYRGEHSSKYNIICDPTTRQLLPARRRSMIEIPGRSGSYVQDGKSYGDREESFKCYYTKKNDADVSGQAREIAYWLSESGTLCFDNEPDKFYTAYFNGALPLIKHLKYGEFDLSFIYSPPFAYARPREITKELTSEDNKIIIPVDGTANTPCRIIIKPTKSQFRKLIISHYMK